MKTAYGISRIKALILFLLTLIWAYKNIGVVTMFLNFSGSASDSSEQAETILYNFLIFGGLSLVTGIVSIFEMRKNFKNDDEEESFLAYFFKSAFFKKGLCGWMVFISVLIPSVQFIVIFAAIAVLFAKAGVGKGNTGSASSNSSSSLNSGDKIVCEGCGGKFPKSLTTYVPEAEGYMCPNCMKQLNDKRGF